jgi:hypothetical protein
MPKSSKKRKQALSSNSGRSSKKLKAQIQPPKSEALDSSDSLIGDLLSQDELDITTETLELLAENPSLIAHKALKLFRTAVHDYWRVAIETSPTGEKLMNRAEQPNSSGTFRNFPGITYLICSRWPTLCRCFGIPFRNEDPWTSAEVRYPAKMGQRL